MPLVTTDIKFYETLNGLGGAITAGESVSGVAGNLFDKFTGDETDTGGVFYGCVYLKNNHGSLTAQDLKAYILSETVFAGINCKLGLGSAAVNGVEQTIADENTAPAGVTFTDLEGDTNTLDVGDVPAGQHKALWFEVTISAGTGARNGYTFATRVKFATDE